jgi:hypothetical protein
MSYNQTLKCRSLIWIIFIGVSVVTLNSCGTLQGLLSGPQEQATTYFAPNFSNGKIVALRNTFGPEVDPGSGSASWPYLISIDLAATSEETPLFRFYYGEVLQLSLSPSLNYIGLLEQDRSSLETIYSVTIYYTRESYEEPVYGCPSLYQHSRFYLKNDTTPTYICFSPDETKLAISFGNEKFIITDLKGNIQKEYLLGGNFIWKSNNEGFFYKKASSRLALINLSDDNVTLYDVDILPMTYNSSEEVIYSLSGNTFEAYKLDSTEVERKTLNFDPAKYVFPHISSDGKKVVLTSTPYNPPDGSSYPRGGIYLIDVAENVLKEIRYYTDEKIIPSK